MVRQHAAAGWVVHACCRTPGKAALLQAIAADYPEQVIVHELDVTDDAQIARLVASLQGTPVDMLFNNAGVYGQSDAWFGNTRRSEWLRALDVNTISPMKMMEALVDNVAASEQRIIATLSSKMGSMADNSSGGSYVYRSTKAALNAVMVSAAHDLKPRGITAVILHPGWVRTDMGGPEGEISVVESVAAMRQILAGLCAEDAGKFYDIDGSIIPW
jgi:NAD(P)-dependent dehydrogenase (short-subunit alcohol dehydrogenase family)